MNKKYDPETLVYIDKDGWIGSDCQDAIAYLIDDSYLKEGGILTINN